MPATALFKIRLQPSKSEYVTYLTATMIDATDKYKATILANQFTDKEGNAPTALTTVTDGTDGFYFLFIDGALQPASNYAVAAAGANLTITLATTETLTAGSLVTLLVAKFG